MSARTSTRPGGDAVRGVFVFALLAAFALLSLLVVIVGARAYRTINARAESAYIGRTGMSYLLGKIRAADEAGMIELFEANGATVLSLGTEIDGTRYNTYIYCDKNWIEEYFSAAEQPFSPDYGEEILAASALNISLEGDLLTIELVDEDGTAHTASIYLQAAKGAGA